MDFRVRLVHADVNQRVVLVRAFEGDRCVGSALGEAAHAEEAEDRALERLRHRLQFPQPEPPAPNLPHAATPVLPEPRSHPSSSPEPARSPREETPVATEDPEDWSADLSQLDLLLRKLGWGKEEERIYLQRLFGQPNRSRLTRYADLLLLRRALEGLTAGSLPGSAPLPLRRSELLDQCDGLLQQLGWTTDQARQALEQHFAATSRQHLSDEQLLAFNLLLESEVLGRLQPT